LRRTLRKKYVPSPTAGKLLSNGFSSSRWFCGSAAARRKQTNGNRAASDHLRAQTPVFSAARWLWGTDGKRLARRRATIVVVGVAPNRASRSGHFDIANVGKAQNHSLWLGTYGILESSRRAERKPSLIRCATKSPGWLWQMDASPSPKLATSLPRLSTIPLPTGVPHPLPQRFQVGIINGHALDRHLVELHCRLEPFLRRVELH